MHQAAFLTCYYIVLIIGLKRKSPARVVAGSRRVQRERKPTWKAAGKDPLNVAVKGSSGTKKLAAQTISKFFASTSNTAAKSSNRITAKDMSDHDISGPSGSEFEGGDEEDSESDEEVAEEEDENGEEKRKVSFSMLL